MTTDLRSCLDCQDILPPGRTDPLCAGCRDRLDDLGAQECARAEAHPSRPLTPLYARGLCSACYTLIERLDLLDRYPDSAELDWIDYCWLRSWGVTIERCAARLGMEFRTALKYERRRRGANYSAWLASLSDLDRERYNLAA